MQEFDIDIIAVLNENGMSTTGCDRDEVNATFSYCANIEAEDLAKEVKGEYDDADLFEQAARGIMADGFLGDILMTHYYPVRYLAKKFGMSEKEIIAEYGDLEDSMPDDLDRIVKERENRA